MKRLDALKTDYAQLQSNLKQIQRTAALISSLPRFFQEQVTVPGAQEEIRRSLNGRADSFLELMRTQVYGRAASPYRKLLHWAGCDFSDLRASIYRHGLEPTLERLAREGVYITSDEFKGKKEIVRGRYAFRVSPDDFEISGGFGGFIIESSGTKNKPVRSLIPLDLLSIQSHVTNAAFSAHDLFSHCHAVYDAVLPGAGGLFSLLIYSKLGILTERWFARQIPVNTWLETQYHYLTTSLIVALGKRFTLSFPKPEFIDTANLQPIVSWISEKKAERKNCCITTVASNAVRIAKLAWDMGQSLEGTQFITTGEPLTAGKREIIERTGAKSTTRYVYGGCLLIGWGCATAVYSDEIHVDQSRIALINNPQAIVDERGPIHPLLCTTLQPAASRLLLNMDNGDYATCETRKCGCALQTVGLTLHLHHIRSYEKFTSEGMNYFYGDLFELLEKILPSEFGGSPGDYQLAEEEDSNGQTRLSLVVHPELGELDEGKALARLRAAFCNGSRGNRFMTSVWENAGTFRIRREVPYASPRGKILPLHINH